MLGATVWRLSPSVPGPGSQGLAGQEQCLHLSLTMVARFPGRGGNTRKATVVFLAIVKDARISNQCCSFRVRQKFADLLHRTCFILYKYYVLIIKNV